MEGRSFSSYLYRCIWVEPPSAVSEVWMGKNSCPLEKPRFPDFRGGETMKYAEIFRQEEYVDFSRISCFGMWKFFGSNRISFFHVGSTPPVGQWSLWSWKNRDWLTNVLVATSWITGVFTEFTPRNLNLSTHRISPITWNPEWNPKKFPWVPACGISP